MRSIRLLNGNLLVPMRAVSSDVVGDGMIEVAPGSPEYETWLPVAEDDPDTVRFHERRRLRRQDTVSSTAS